MADVEDQQQGGPRTSRSSVRKKRTGKSPKPEPQSQNDWTSASGPRPRPSPHPKRHGDIDIDIDIVESSDDSDDAQASPPKQQQPSRRPSKQRQQLPSPTDSEDSDLPSKPPSRSRHRTAAMRPNSTVPLVDTKAMARRMQHRPSYDDDDDDDEPPIRPSRPASRQTMASRRDQSSRSAHRYRSTPESRRSPRTSMSDSEGETDVTEDSLEEVVIQQPTRRRKPPAVPTAPVPPPAPSMHERLNRRTEEPEIEVVYEDPDPEPDFASTRYEQSVGVGRSRAQSRAPSRAPSRAASVKPDAYRRPRDVSRAPSLDGDRARSKSRTRRPSTRQYESDAYVSRAPSVFRRANTTIEGSHHASSQSFSSKRSMFADPTAANNMQLERQQPKRFTTCVSCRDNKTLVENTAKLKCAHRMCNTCLVRSFELSLRGPQHMPPRCCTAEPIPPKHVDKLLGEDFKAEWNRKYREYTTRSRIYCPEERCGRWFQPDNIRQENGRGQAKCSHCKTKVCCACHGLWHPQYSCPGDENTAQFMPQSKRDTYQTCYQCHHMVELAEGCNHMKCRCGAQFCMLCGGPWKSCACPMTNNSVQAVSRAAVDRMRTPMDEPPNPFASAPKYASRVPSPQALRSGFPASYAGTVKPRPSSYEEEPYLARRMEVREEPHHARRMHSFDDAFGHVDDQAEYGRGRAGVNVFDFEEQPRRRIEARSRGASFGNGDFRAGRAATVVAPSPPQTHVPMAPPPPRSAFEPPSRPAFDRVPPRAAPRADYASEAYAQRAARYASPERYEEFAAENYTADRRRPYSPERRQTFPTARRPRSLDRHHPFAQERREESPDGWQVPTRFPSPERGAPMAMEIPQKPRHMLAPERHMQIPERHMAPQDRHMQLPERHMATPDRYASMSERHAPMPERQQQQMPERHMAMPERQLAHSDDRLRAPSPERRRASSFDKRLADRFNPESRQSPGAYHMGGMGHAVPPAAMTTIGVGPVGPPGHMGHMGMINAMVPQGPLSPTRGPPPLSRTASHPAAAMMHGHGGGPSIPVAPVPPPAISHMPRRHTMEEDIYVSGRHPGGPTPEWFGPPGMGMGLHEWDPSGGSARAPHIRRRATQAHREHNKTEAKPSMQAGLSGSGRGLHRVSEWVNYIEPGPPEDTMRGGGPATIVG
ncbi:hypothetical protein QC764_602850 [Podospora pseudoanserina]|uniref:RBR-type E3 ubiquitin transferase n=1 Tax=Podospora pseudoanserina TaxID=2609844 RepID=A0ABR0HTJ4_9PEZI|nr:hypothetical protein QC764_602850 [Podospora pseudoanserina]